MVDVLRNSAVGKDALKQGRRQIGRLFYWKTIGIVLCLSSLGCLQTLQTSINIEGDKGAISLTAAYLTSILFSLFCTPALLRILGPNVALVIGDACFLAYSLSNFVPELALLTVGATISGVARSTFFPAYTLLVLDIASKCAELAESKDNAYYENYFQSRFYCMVESVTIVGNSISYAILYGVKAARGTDIEPNTTSPISNATFFTGDLYEFCGVKDCQDPAVVNDSIDQYVPPDEISVYLLVAVASCLCISAMLVHSLVYPGLGMYSNKLVKIGEKALEVQAQTRDVLGVLNDENSRTISSCDRSSYDNLEFRSEGTTNSNSAHSILNGASAENSENDLGEIDLTTSVREVTGRNQKPFAKKAETKNVLNILKLTAMFFVRPRALMLNVSSLRNGMMFGFVFADLTRAYASCVAGVEMTGLFAVTFGLTAMPSALLYGQLTFRWRRYILFAASSALELGLFVACYLWVPDPDSLWILFVIFAGFGMVNGIFRQNIVAAFTLHFPKNKTVAFSVFNIFFSIGFGLQYALSTFMCVVDKIYTQIAIIVAGSALFVIAEYLQHRTSRRRKSEVATSFETEEQT